MTAPFQLETPRLILRPWSDADFSALAAIHADPDVMRYIGHGRPRGLEKVRESLARNIEGQNRCGYCMWAIVHKDDSQLAGSCGLRDFPDGAVETGWLLARKYWGQGLATEAARRAQQHAFETLGIRRLCAIAHPPNLASRRIMEKLGMHYVKNMEYDNVDVVYYAVDNPQVAAD